MKSVLFPQSGRIIRIDSGGARLALRAGEVVKAEIVDILSSHTVSVRIRNRILKADTDLPLKKGERVVLQVEGQEDRIRLRLAGGDTDSPSVARERVLAAIKKMQPARVSSSEMKAVRRLIDSMPKEAGRGLPGLDRLGRFLLEMEELSGRSLQKSLRSSGLFFESRLRALLLKYLPGRSVMEAALGTGAEETPSGDTSAGRLPAFFREDMKFILLRFRVLLRSAAVIRQLKQYGTSPRQLEKTINKLIENIEYYQLQSRLHDALQIFIPLFWEDMNDGEFIFRRRKGGAGGTETYSCIIDLDLKRTGRFAAYVLLLDGAFHLHFFSDSRDFTNLIRRSSGILEDEFLKEGLRIGSFSVKYDRNMNFQYTMDDRIDLRA